MNKKSIVYLLVFALVAVACATEAAEEVTVEDDHDHEGESTLEQNLEWFEEGMDLIKTCQTHLVDADKRVQKLITPSKGEDKIKDIE